MQSVAICWADEGDALFAVFQRAAKPIEAVIKARYTQSEIAKVGHKLHNITQMLNERSCMKHNLRQLEVSPNGGKVLAGERSWIRGFAIALDERVMPKEKNSKEWSDALRNLVMAASR